MLYYNKLEVQNVIRCSYRTSSNFARISFDLSFGFYKVLETEQGNFFTAQITPEEKSKQAFFDLAGKVHLDTIR